MKRHKKRGYAAIGVYSPKYAKNVGGVLRAAGCYDASFVAIEAPRKQANHGISSGMNTMKVHRHIPVVVGGLHDLIPHGCVPVCVEISPGAVALDEYTHPERAFYVLGPEDGSVPKEIQAWCRDTIYIPTTQCMNLAATANVVLFHRCSQRQEWE